MARWEWRMLIAYNYKLQSGTEVVTSMLLQGVQCQYSTRTMVKLYQDALFYFMFRQANTWIICWMCERVYDQRSYLLSISLLTLNMSGKGADNGYSTFRLKSQRLIGKYIGSSDDCVLWQKKGQ